MGLYRDGTNLMPIVVRPPDQERLNIDTIHDVQLWSSTFNRYVMIDEVVDEFTTEWEDPLIQRQDRKRTLTVLSDPDVFGSDTTNDLFGRLRPRIEAIEMPQGYRLEWGGEFESSNDANAAVFASLPLGFLGMVPLLADAFFESMAVTIMFGLGFATILTLVVVPVLYTMLHGINYRPLKELD